MKKKTLFFLFCLLIPVAFSQDFRLIERYLRIDASAKDPLYTTYAAAIPRSKLYADKAYKMDYYSGCKPVSYSSDQAGVMFAIWKVDQVVIMNSAEYFHQPVVLFSFPDMAILEYEPFRGISVRETFFVYSSGIAMVDLTITNRDSRSHDITLYPVLETGNDSLEVEGYDTLLKGYRTLR